MAKYVRLDQVTYPDGNREVHYDYGTAGAVDDIMSRLATIGDGANTQASYKYLGLGTIVEEDYDQADVKLSYLDGSGNVTGLDRFGRVREQVWTDYGANPDEVIDHYIYTYDRASNRTSKTNELDHDFDEDYTYDDLDRLAEWKLNDVSQKTWTNLDGLGNDLDSGTYSAANEMTPDGMGGDLYDAAGNMTTLQSGDTAKYDAWNRLNEISDVSGILERYEYDGTGRRIQTFTNFTGGPPPTTADVQNDYHLGQQVIESAKTTAYNLSTSSGGTLAGGYQYLWSPRYIDAPVLRDTLAADQTAIVAAERLFYIGDANYNVTAVVKQVSGNWQVVERYSYTPYGVVTFRNAAGADVGSSANANTILYTGRDYSVLTDLYYYRARFYDAGLERFVNRDPIRYLAGDHNLYRYVSNNPLTWTDPNGLMKVCCRSVRGGFLNSLFQHCKIEETCPKSTKQEIWTGYDIWQSKSPSRTLDDGTPCSQANPDQIKKCMARHPYSADPRGTGNGWGNNCQTSTLLTLGNCCLNSTWIPNLYAGSARGKCIKGHSQSYNLGREGTFTVWICDEWELPDWIGDSSKLCPDSTKPKPKS